ncbi:MAG: hypothetical protein AB7E32_11695 [Desulfovibrio sp.]
MLLCVLTLCGAFLVRAETAVVAGTPFGPSALPMRDLRFAGFLEGLEAAVEARDEQAILELVDEECLVAHGGFHGREGFRQYWFGTASPGGDLFGRLAAALQLGGTVAGADREFFVLPYTALAPAEDLQGALLGVVVAEKAKLRAAPGLKSAVRSELGQTLVRYCSNRFVPYKVDGREWVCLLGPDNKPGFALREEVRSPLDTAFVFHRTEAGWRLTACGAGAELDLPQASGRPSTR